MTPTNQTAAVGGRQGDWLVIRNYSLSVRHIDKVTEKLFKLGAGDGRYPTQIGRADSRIVCSAPTREEADRLRQAIAGIDGDYSRRRQAADRDRNERVRQAEEARQSSISKLLRAALQQAEAGGHE